MPKIIAPMVIFLFTVVISIVEAAVEDRIDSVVSSEMARQKIPGLSVAVTRAGQALIAKGYGLANIEHQVPVKPVSVFQSGSIGKQFTAFAIMLLVEDGKIELDEEIGTYLGDVPESWSGITVRHLLTHTGGMADTDHDFQLDHTEDELLELTKKTPVAFPPGERWEYSNDGYVVLGIMIGKVSGQFYGDFLEERVFGPLDMRTAGVISDRDITPNRAAGYEYEKGVLKNQEWVSKTANSTADGSLDSSTLDLAKWDTALRQRKILSEESYRNMWAPVRLNNGRTYPYGFGWVLKTVNGHRIIEHGGAWRGFMSFFSRYPDDGLAVIVFGNIRQMDPARIAHLVAEAVEPDLKPRVINPSGEEVTAWLCRIYQQLQAGQAERTVFTEELADEIIDEPTNGLMWIEEDGPARRFLLMEEETSADGDQYSFRAEHDGVTLYFRMVLNAEGKVSVFEMHQD
ncbi:MAG: beta-lactamase family protein [Gammaproteobacteria bacterium]|nr:beta-lactamase family protein [Gammaproteobacteria bacterium]